MLAAALVLGVILRSSCIDRSANSCSVFVGCGFTKAFRAASRCTRFPSDNAASKRSAMACSFRLLSSDPFALTLRAEFPIGSESKAGGFEDCSIFYILQFRRAMTCRRAGLDIRRVTETD